MEIKFSKSEPGGISFVLEYIGSGAIFSMNQFSELYASRINFLYSRGKTQHI